MIIGLGVDLVDNNRIERELAQCEWSREDGIFTSEEIRHCRFGSHSARRYAACFAAKEAALKALGAEVGDMAVFREVEVGLGPGGKCGIVLHDRLRSKAGRLKVQHILLSIAAGKKQTGAMVILEA